MQPQGEIKKPRFWIDQIQGDDAAGQYSTLLDQSFGVAAPGRFFDDFPIWDERLGPERTRLIRLGVFHDRKLVSCAGVRLAQLKSAQKSVKAALIGAVATHPEWRGQGLATQLVSIAVQWAQEREAALAILWGSDHELYRKLGFELCGEQVRVPLTEFVQNARGAKVHEGWDPGLFSLIQSRGEGIALEASDIKWYGAHKNVRWFWAGSPGRPKAYAAFGRGIDLGGIVHEWGGDSEELRSVLAHIHKMQSSAVILGSPENLRTVGIKSTNAAVEFLGLVKLLNPAAVVEGFLPGTPFTAERTAGGWKTEFAGSGPVSAHELSDGDLAQLLFGPASPGSRQQIARLPLWVWGLDAV